MACETSGDGPGNTPQAPDTTAPDPVLNLRVTDATTRNDGKSSLTVTWEDPEDADLKEIEISCEPECPGQHVAAKGDETYTISIPKGTQKKTEYMVKAVAKDTSDNKAAAASARSPAIFDFEESVAEYGAEVPSYANYPPLFAIANYLTKHGDGRVRFVPPTLATATSIPAQTPASPVALPVVATQGSGGGHTIDNSITRFNYDPDTDTLTLEGTYTDSDPSPMTGHEAIVNIAPGIQSASESVYIGNTVNQFRTGALNITSSPYTVEIPKLRLLWHNIQGAHPNRLDIRCLALGGNRTRSADATLQLPLNYVIGDKVVGFRFQDGSGSGFEIRGSSGMIRPAGTRNGAQNQRLNYEKNTEHRLVVEMVVDGNVESLIFLKVNVTDVADLVGDSAGSEDALGSTDGF